ncbi:uncharacterized protein LOC116296873 [Actinia tenebrosa]|uniref:Uncharacterized protein LOC116296873 n=1 Tax=Actinia tenebrosa TaxID=6105 RepID=A0A6P8HWR5_ACTTE|nr:uncharacterized protein LOC116296873 [Actinia tenebrosa]
MFNNAQLKEHGELLNKSMDGENSSKFVKGLKQLNYQRSSGLLCLLDEEKNQEEEKNPGVEVKQNGVEDFEIKAKENGAEIRLQCNTNGGQFEQTSAAGTGLFDEVSKAFKKKRSIANKCKVYVGNIGYKVRSREFKEFFSAFGRVLQAQIVQDRIKKRSRGFGFVTYSNEYEAQKAKQSADEERTLHDRVMTVMTPTRKRKGGPVSKEQSLEEALEEFQNLSLLEEKESNENLDNEKGQLSISDLNDDILILIFSYLQLKDKIHIERVCTRWKCLLLKVWPSVTHLDFKNLFSLYKGGLTDDILLGIFRRGCKNLTSLDLSASPFLLTEFAVHCIAKHCKNLREINITGVEVSTSSLKTLSKECSKLEKLVLRRCYQAGEKGFWWIFKQCTNLKHIDISDNKRLSGKCFFMLSDTVESLILSHCSRLTDSSGAFIGTRCKNLKYIDISECLSLTDTGVRDIIQGCPKIEEFYFKKCPKTVTTHGLSVLSRLNHLVVLDLSLCDAVDDQILLLLGQSSIHLKSLNIEGCFGNITDTGLQALITCHTLETLNISYVDEITDVSISQLARNGSIQTFVARACSGLSDDVVRSLLCHCTNLTTLDMSGSINITDISLNHLTEYYTSSQRPVLTFIIGGTQITEKGVSDTCSPCHNNCKIDTFDLSSESLRFGNPRLQSIAPFLEESDEDDNDSDGEDEDNHIEQINYEMGNDVYQDFLEADDPALMMDEEYWMFDHD